MLRATSWPSCCHDPVAPSYAPVPLHSERTKGVSSIANTPCPILQMDDEAAVVTLGGSMEHDALTLVTPKRDAVMSRL